MSHLRHHISHSVTLKNMAAIVRDGKKRMERGDRKGADTSLAHPAIRNYQSVVLTQHQYDGCLTSGAILKMSTAGKRKHLHHLEVAHGSRHQMRGLCLRLFIRFRRNGCSHQMVISSKDRRDLEVCHFRVLRGTTKGQMETTIDSDSREVKIMI